MQKSPATRAGADGATAPETLRPQDCKDQDNLESGALAPTEGEPGARPGETLR